MIVVITIVIVATKIVIFKGIINNNKVGNKESTIIAKFINSNSKVGMIPTRKVLTKALPVINSNSKDGTIPTHRDTIAIISETQEEGMSTIGTLGTKSESLAINIIIRRDGEIVVEGEAVAEVENMVVEVEKVWGEEVIEMNFIIARDQEMTTMIVIDDRKKD